MKTIQTIIILFASGLLCLLVLTGIAFLMLAPISTFVIVGGCAILLLVMAVVIVGTMSLLKETFATKPPST